MATDRFTRQRDALLTQYGFEMVRSGKHQIWRNAAGRTLTFSATPSDWRAARNQVSEIRRAMQSEQLDTTIEDSVPKRDRKRAGRSRPASEFRFRYDLAPRSIPATPEQTIKTLRGLLASRSAYTFKSTFVRVALEKFRQTWVDQDAELGNVLRDYDSLAAEFVQVANNAPVIDGMRTVVSTGLSPELNRLAYEYLHVLERFPEERERVDDAKHPDENLLKKLRRYLALVLADSPSECERQARFLTSLAGRVANQLLRGASREECETLILKSNLEYNAPFICELLEEVAAVTIELHLAAS